MYTTKLFVLLLVTLCESKKSLVPQAISQLVQKRYRGSSEIIEIFYNSGRIGTIDQTLKFLNVAVQHVKVTKVETTYEKNQIVEINNDAIFLFDTVENYLNHVKHAMLAPKNEQVELHVWFYCADLSNHDIKRVTPNSQIFKNYLLEENGEIVLNAHVMYTKKQCKSPQLIEINRFKMLARKWSTGKFHSTEIENFYGCELSFQLFHEHLPFVNIERLNDGKTSAIDGVLIKMVEALSKSLNFTTGFRLYEDMNKYGDLEDWKLETKIITDQVFDWDTISDPIFSSSDVFIVPPGEPYTPWEILFLPFDEATWMWTGIFFGVAFLVILLVKLSKSNSIYEFVIGTNVATPALNVIAILMGIGQMLLPSRNIPRFLFINFVIFCLIMRTAYQGKYFEFITGDMRRRPVSSVEELKERNFTVYIEHGGRGISSQDYEILQG